MDGDDVLVNGRGTPHVIRTRGALADLSRQLAGVSMILLSTPNTHNQLPSSLLTPCCRPRAAGIINATQGFGLMTLYCVTH